MQDALADSPLIREDERVVLDKLFEECYRVSSVTEDKVARRRNFPPGILAAQNVTRWRYKWARILLHRPTLLWCTISKTSCMDLPEDRKTSVQLCRDITRDLIQDISKTGGGRIDNIMAAWGATWHLYQATMVPLLALFSDTCDESLLEDCVAQVECSKATLSCLQEHMMSAGPSLKTITLLYEVSKRRKMKRAEIATQAENQIPCANLPEIGILAPLSSDEPGPAHPTRINHNLFIPDELSNTEGLFDILEWNQFSTYGHDYSFKIGLDWDISEPRVADGHLQQDSRD